MAAEYDEEDAARLQFPRQFQHTETLMNSEVRMLLEHRQKKDGQEDVELSEVFQVVFNLLLKIILLKIRVFKNVIIHENKNCKNSIYNFKNLN